MNTQQCSTVTMSGSTECAASHSGTEALCWGCVHQLGTGLMCVPRCACCLLRMLGLSEPPMTMVLQDTSSTDALYAEPSLAQCAATPF